MSSDKLRCRCGFEFPVQPEDRGFSVYCPSCAQECFVPAGQGETVPVTVDCQALAPAATVESLPQRIHRSSVFSCDGSSSAASRTVAEIVCLCGGRVSVSPSDYGTTVYCPSCGAGLSVGEHLAESPSLPTRATAEQEGAASVRSRSAVAAPQRRSYLNSVAAVACSAVLLVLGWFATVHWSRASSTDAPVWSVLGGLGSGPPTQTSDDAQANVDTLATVSANTDVFDDPVDAVTLAQIEALLVADNKRAALIDAEVWQQLLADRGLPPDEPRRGRLEEVTAALIDQLTPKPSPPDPAIQPFRELLGRLHEALAAEQLAEARQLSAEATAMFQTSAQVLAPFSRRLLLQQARLKQLEARVEGLAEIERRLRQALEEAQAGRALEALEARAAALYRAHDVGVESEAEEARLQALAAELREPLRLARGKRAVEDAGRCQELSDRTNRNDQLQIARSLLPGLPESEIKPLLATVEKLSGTPIARPRESPFGQEIAARTLYEAGLEHYSRGALGELVDLAAKSGDGELAVAKGYREKLTALAVSTIEDRLTNLAAGAAPSMDRTAAFVELQTACDKLSSSGEDPRLRALRASLEHETGELAAKALADGKRLATSDRLAEAVAAIGPATQLGSAADREGAKRLRDQWQAEIELRASLPAQAEHRRRIEELAQANDVAGAARELALFERRYPRSPHAADIMALKARLLPQVRRLFDDLAARAEAAWKAEHWAEFMTLIASIEALAPVANEDATLERLREQRSRLLARFDGRLQEAEWAVRMVKDDEIITVLQAAKEALSIVPDHPRATELLESARTAARDRARRLMTKAEAFRRNRLLNTTYRKLLESVVLLDAEGDDGRQARRQLDNLQNK